MSTQPTDDEIDALWRFEASKNWDSTLAMRTSFTRAALARWGQPAHSRESILYDPKALLEVFQEAQAGSRSTAGTLRGIAAVIASWESRTDPHTWLIASPQPVEREPLSDEWIRSRCKESWIFDTAKQWIRMTEAAHGIKGGQHGTE